MCQALQLPYMGMHGLCDDARHCIGNTMLAMGKHWIQPCLDLVPESVMATVAHVCFSKL